MRIFIFIFLVFSSLYSSTFNLKESFLVDKTNSLTLNEVINTQQNFKEFKKTNLGVISDDIWIHLNIKNPNSSPIEKRFYNRRAGLDYIDVYFIKNKEIVKRYTLGDMREHKIRDNNFRVSYFDVKLQAKDSIDIFIKQRAYGTMEIKWDMVDISYFNNYFNKQLMVYFMIFGILIVATLVSLFFFIMLRNRFYLYYTLFTLCSIIYQFAVAGFFYELGSPIYLNTFFVYVVSLLGLVFLGLFPFSFFNLKKNEYSYLIKLLRFLVFLVFIFALSHCFYPFDYDVLRNVRYTNVLFIFTMFILLVLSIRAFIDKKQGAIFYLISNTILFISIGYFVLGLVGQVSNNDLYYYSLSFGAISQDIFLALALVQATYSIKKDNEKNAQLLDQYSKLSFIGQTMVNISHQWKTPINSIFNSINHIEIAKEFKDKDLDNIIDKNLTNIKDSTNYIKEIAFSHLNFYKEKTNLEQINILNELKFVVKLIENEFDKKSIDIDLRCDSSLVYKLEKNYFLNVLMILLENSFKVIEQRAIKKPKIQISVKKIDNYLSIHFLDNAKGISNEEISKIFEKNYSLTDSTGIGLYLAKEIVEYKLNGKIEVKNSSEGVVFDITIK